MCIRDSLRVNSNYHNRVADLNFLSAINQRIIMPAPSSSGRRRLPTPFEEDRGQAPVAVFQLPRPPSLLQLNCFVLFCRWQALVAFQRGESGSLPELKLVVENNRYSYSTPSRCSPAAFQPADLSHLTLGGNSPFALSVSPRPLAAKLLNLEARNYLNLRWEICKRT